MTKQEFELLTGWLVSDQEYAEYDAMYLAAGELDKREFCADLKKHCDSKIIRELADECRKRNRRGEDAMLEVERLEKENTRLRNELTERLMIDVFRSGNTDDRERAIELCGGVRKYLAKKMIMGLTPLSEDDLSDVKDIILNEIK